MKYASTLGCVGPIFARVGPILVMLGNVGPVLGPYCAYLEPFRARCKDARQTRQRHLGQQHHGYRSLLWICAAYMELRSYCTGNVAQGSISSGYSRENIIAIPGIHYFDAHRLEALLLTAFSFNPAHAIPQNRKGQATQWRILPLTRNCLRPTRKIPVRR